jgi:hypothetical protein
MNDGKDGPIDFPYDGIEFDKICGESVKERK